MTPSAQLAAALLEAEDSCRPIPPPTDRLPALSIRDAYEIQQEGLRLRRDRGATVAGHKVGLTSKAMQEMLGVDQPDFGYLTTDMLSPSGSVLDAARFIAPRVEAEIAFRLSSRLEGSALDIDDVLAATEAVAPALEVIDSRVADWRIKISDTIADNASCGHVVIGELRPPTEFDLSTVSMDLIVETPGQPVEMVGGRGDAVLGHPARAVAWLARALDEYGADGLEAGEVVIPGAMARALPVAAGSVARSTMTGLGDVSVRFGGGD